MVLEGNLSESQIFGRLREERGRNAQKEAGAGPPKRKLLGTLYELPGSGERGKDPEIVSQSCEELRVPAWLSSDPLGNPGPCRAPPSFLPKFS